MTEEKRELQPLANDPSDVPFAWTLGAPVEPPETTRHELQPLSNVSLNVLFLGSMGIIAKLLKIRKRDLRKAKKIIDEPELIEEVSIKDKSVKMTFYRGFYSFIKRIKMKQRRIMAPHPSVQLVFKAIKNMLVELGNAHEKAFGFVKKRNIKMAVESLLGNTHFISFDIADAFPSISIEMIGEALEELGLSQEVIHPLAWLTTHLYDRKRRLPQGSSCSPALLNLVYKPMCQEIDEFCRIHGLSWFVYADDFHFASEEEISLRVKDELLAIPSRYGFSIKKRKTRDNLGKTIPHLLGLTIVDGEIHLRRRTKKKLRNMLYLAWKYGAHSPAQIQGAISIIRQIYGQEENWPGWLLEYWVKYQAKRQAEGENHARKRRSGENQEKQLPLWE